MKRAIIYQLMLKEIKESLSSLFLGIFLLGGYTFMAMHSRLIPDVAILTIALLMSILFAVMWGMSPIAEERQAGTLDLLLALPIKPRVFFHIKMLVSTICVMIPLAISFAIYLFIAGEREVELQFVLSIYLCMSLLTIITLYWTVCIGITQPTEARVFMMAMGVYFGGWAILMLIDQFRIFSPVMMFRIISLTPVGILALTDFKQLTLKDQNWLILSLVINTIVLIAMYCWALSRLEKPVKTRG